jgi:hypothetical protein
MTCNPVHWLVSTLAFLSLNVLCPIVVNAAEIRGSYLETRSCQIYTGPCFANAEIGLMGKDAMLAWHVDQGSHQGVELAGLSVIMLISATDTLAHAGIDDPKGIKSVIIVDERATASQREALIDFVRQRTGRAGREVVRVKTSPIDMQLDEINLRGEVTAGAMVKLSTRRARKGDCICSNEIAYYPPLTELQNFTPGVSIEAEVKGSVVGGQRWSMPNSRSAYMGLFAF